MRTLSMVRYYRRRGEGLQMNQRAVDVVKGEMSIAWTTKESRLIRKRVSHGGSGSS